MVDNNLITEDKFMRFKDAEWFDTDNKPVLIGGVGGIGSWLSLLLARAGMLPYVYDFDSLEAHNLGGQLYSNKQIGKTKVDALYDIIQDFCNTGIIRFNEKVTIDTMSNNYVFSCFDNMEARKALFEAWVNANGDLDNRLPNGAAYFDGRLNLEQMQIFCVQNTNEDVQKYRKYLFDDSEVEDAPCTARQTSGAAAMIASHMWSFFVNHLTNVKSEINKRSVPFYWEYFLPLDLVSYQPEEE